MDVVNPTSAAEPDATEHAIQLLARENKILELIARGAALEKVLKEIAYAAENFCDGAVRCSILLLDESGTHLLHGAAPSLPKEYNNAIHGTTVSSNNGSCGAAVFRKKPVIVADIENAPSWKHLRDLAHKFGLRACWSTPVNSSQGEVIGSFALYYSEPSRPSPSTLQVVDLLSRTASIAIERHRSESQRVRYQKQIEKLNDTGILLAAERDPQKIVQAATDTAREFSGAAFAVFIYNVNGIGGESRTLHTVSGADYEALSEFPLPRGTNIFAPTFARAGTVRIADVTKDQRYGRKTPHPEKREGHVAVCSYLAVPVVSRSGEVIGGLFLGHPEVDKFTQEAAHLVESIAAQAAVAIDNAHLNDGIARQLASSKEVQQRLAIAQQSAQLATWELDLRTNEIRFSPGSWPVFGCELSRIKMWHDWESQIHPEDRDSIREQLEQAIEQEKDYFAEYRVQTPLGTRWLQERAHVVFETGTSEPERVVVLSIDITERRLADEALHLSDQKFREAQQAASMGTWFCEIGADKLTWSTEVPSLQGAVLSQSVKDWAEAVHPDDIKTARAEVERAFREGGPFRMECRVRKANGEYAWCFTQGQIRLDENRKPISAVGITVDITARRRAEQELRRTQERFGLIVDTADIGFWYCDLPAVELRWDARVKNHFWLPADASVTIEDFYRIVHPDDRERIRRATEAAIQNHCKCDIDYRTVSPEGEVKWVRSVGRGFYDASGNPTSFDGMTMDITARRKAEDALRSSEKLAATGRLAATIAHEINNPLEAVTNFIYLAKTTEGIYPQVQDYLEVADQELMRVSHIARQTLGFYRDASGPKIIKVDELVHDVLNLYQRKISYKSLDLQVDVAADLKISGLAGEMRQVLSNLLANAIDASRAAGKIRIRARGTCDWKTGMNATRVTLADSGCGMSADVRKRLFTPFFTTKADVGTGLGLWVTKGMVEKAKGRICVRSRENAGTAFSMIFPSNTVAPVPLKKSAA